MLQRRKAGRGVVGSHISPRDIILVSALFRFHLVVMPSNITLEICICLLHVLGVCGKGAGIGKVTAWIAAAILFLATGAILLCLASQEKSVSRLR